MKTDNSAQCSMSEPEKVVGQPAGSGQNESSNLQEKYRAAVKANNYKEAQTLLSEIRTSERNRRLVRK